MSSMECPKLCPDCPVRREFIGEPTAITELESRMASEFFINANVVNDERISFLSIKGEAGEHSFPALSGELDSGELLLDFDVCEGPVKQMIPYGGQIVQIIGCAVVNKHIALLNSRINGE